MYNKYCKQCGRFSNGYPLCKSCYYKKIDEEEYEESGSSTSINIDVGAIVQGIATIVQCFKSPQNNTQQQNSEPNFRLSKEPSIKTKAKKWLTKAGFYVRSQQERTISDFLTENGISHTYEKHFYVGEGEYILPDFYIKGPVNFKGRTIRNIYIEHFGRENDVEYNSKNSEKLQEYKKRKITVIITYPEDIEEYSESLEYKLTHYREYQVNYYKGL